MLRTHFTSHISHLTLMEFSISRFWQMLNIKLLENGKWKMENGIEGAIK